MTETQMLEDRMRERRVSVRQAASFLVALALGFTLLTVGLSLGLPYAPTTVDLYEIVPDVVCPGQETKVRTGFSVDKPLMGTVTGFTVDSAWVKDGAPDRITLPSTPIPFDGVYGYHDQESPVLRFAPNDPGVWHLETILTTHGQQALHLASDTVTGIRSNPVRVLPFDNPACQAAFGG